MEGQLLEQDHLQQGLCQEQRESYRELEEHHQLHILDYQQEDQVVERELRELAQEEVGQERPLRELEVLQ